MKSDLVLRLFVLWFLVAVSGGCTCARANEVERMNVLGAALTKLSGSVESTVRYKNPPEGIGDAELLSLSTKHDPGLLEPFADYKLRVSRQDNHAVVLVCDKDGKTGLLEDAGCSSEMDRHLWKEEPPKPCEFTLKAKVTCPPVQPPAQ
jgi:hypothetical protein